MAITVLIDTNVILNAKNSNEPQSAYSVQVLDAVEGGIMQGVISTISIAELCAGYYSQDDMKGKEELLAHLISSRYFSIVELDLKIADKAADIRADTGLRLPDAVIVATGLVKGVKYIVTNDVELKKASRYLEVISPKEVLAKIGRNIQKK